MALERRFEKLIKLFTLVHEFSIQNAEELMDHEDCGWDGRILDGFCLSTSQSGLAARIFGRANSDK